MDFYEILGLTPTASAAEVRQAYLRLAREKHPDRFPDPAEKQKAEEHFARVTEAFNTLSNAKSREQYDAERSKPKLSAPAEIAADAYQRALQKVQERDFHEAMTLLRTAVHHAPEAAAYHLALAKVLAKNPNWLREAIEEIEHVIRLEPNRAAGHYEMALILQAQGLRLRARRSAETALRLAPGNADVQKLAAELEVGVSSPPPGPEARPAGGLLDRFRKKP
jgi:tetratricopeptide (TPR) repeat protein